MEWMSLLGRSDYSENQREKGESFAIIEFNFLWTENYLFRQNSPYLFFLCSKSRASSPDWLLLYPETALIMEKDSENENFDNDTEIIYNFEPYEDALLKDNKESVFTPRSLLSVSLEGECGGFSVDMFLILCFRHL